MRLFPQPEPGQRCLLAFRPSGVRVTIFRPARRRHQHRYLCGMVGTDSWGSAPQCHQHQREQAGGDGSGLVARQVGKAPFTCAGMEVHSHEALGFSRAGTQKRNWPPNLASNDGWWGHWGRPVPPVYSTTADLNPPTTVVASAWADRLAADLAFAGMDRDQWNLHWRGGRRRSPRRRPTFGRSKPARMLAVPKAAPQASPTTQSACPTASDHRRRESPGGRHNAREPTL